MCGSEGGYPGGAPPAAAAAGPPEYGLNALQAAITSMEEKGLQDDARYSQLIAIRAKHSQAQVSRASAVQRVSGRVRPLPSVSVS